MNKKNIQICLCAIFFYCVQLLSAEKTSQSFFILEEAECLVLKNPPIYQATKIRDNKVNYQSIEQVELFTYSDKLVIYPQFIQDFQGEIDRVQRKTSSKKVTYDFLKKQMCCKDYYELHCMNNDLQVATIRALDNAYRRNNMDDSRLDSLANKDEYEKIVTWNNKFFTVASACCFCCLPLIHKVQLEQTEQQALAINKKLKKIHATYVDIWD